MENENIVFILIAVVLAIVNAAAQKRKKQQRSATLGAEPQLAHEETTDFFRDGIHSSDALDQSPWDDEADSVLDQDYKTGKQAAAGSVASPESLAFKQRLEKLNARTAFQPIEEGVKSLGNQGQSSDGKRSSKGEGEAVNQDAKHGSITKDFDAKKAIIFSEIIKPKYFNI